MDLLLDEGDVDAILMGRRTQYPAEAVQLVERLAQEFVNDLFSTLRERMLDLRYCKVVFVGGGAILLQNARFLLHRNLHFSHSCLFRQDIPYAD